MKILKRWNTNQPYREYILVTHPDIAGDVVIAGMAMGQSWDCQPMAMGARICSLGGRAASNEEKAAIAAILGKLLPHRFSLE